METSILTSIKKLLGLAENDTSFDTDIIIHINSVFNILKQLGVGPNGGFYIEGEDETWEDFLDDESFLEMIKSYIYLKVRMQFDPPNSGVYAEAINKQIAEYEWRSNVDVETDW